MMRPSTRYALHPRFSSRILVPLTLLVTVALPLYYLFFHHLERIPSHHLRNGVHRYAPAWVHPLTDKLLTATQVDRAPTILPGLINATWPGAFPLPILSVATYALDGRLSSPALLMLHFFSTSSSHSRTRRSLIRKYSPLDSVPRAYQHLVDIRFILGRPDPSYALTDEQISEESSIAREAELYGDIVRLDDLDDGDNMNNGKTWEWVRWVGREGGKEAWWVIKSDDDTLPILPSLIPILTGQDPHDPTYLGSALGHYPGFHYYFEGMMYGFSWGVVKTLATAKVDTSTRNRGQDEDARMGELMYSLPSSPSCSEALTSPLLHQCDPLQPPLGGWSGTPPSPDPRTGLIRLDFGNRIGNFAHWWIKGKGAVAWHDLKKDDDYIEAHRAAEASFGGSGKNIWHPPPDFEGYRASVVNMG